MALPRIPSAEPVTISPLPDTYPDLFISDLRIKCLPGKPWRVSAVFLPYNWDSNVLQPDGTPKELIVGDILAKSAEYQATVGLAMGAILQVAPLMLREQQLQAVAEPTAEQQAELAAVQAALRGEA